MADLVRGQVRKRLRDHGLTLPPIPPPIGRFRHGRIDRGLLFLSGQGPVQEDGSLARGKVGRDFTAAQAEEHARRTGLVLISVMENVLGDLDRVGGIMKLLGFVNCTDDFAEHSRVIDGCSNLFHDVFGEAGVHARSAIGLSSLPGQIPVEIEAIVSVRD